MPSPDEPVSELRSVPIRDNGEPLIDFMELSDRLYWQPEHPVFEYQRFRLARETVARMLARAAESLPAALRLAVVEGWRPPSIQQAMHHATRERLRREHPEWSEAQLIEAAERFSAPMDEQVPPPHTTGGAVDVHLVDAAGQILDFQSPYTILDPRGAPFAAEGLSAEARRNRELLHRAMSAAGLTNYPAEWWHWSYGDQGWAYRGGHPAALYAAIQPSNLDNADFSFRAKAEPGF
jgi:D-alanyl-D-alanine dipeptidase